MQRSREIIPISYYHSFLKVMLLSLKRKTLLKQIRSEFYIVLLKNKNASPGNLRNKFGLTAAALTCAKIPQCSLVF